MRDLRWEGEIDLRRGATLEHDRPYLVPLIEELRLPEGVRAKGNPKSSTGRLDVFTRVITDRNHRFDEIALGYRGKLYLEIVPRSFAITVQTGLALNQLRLISGDPRMSEQDLHTLHDEYPLMYSGGHPMRGVDLPITDHGLFLSLDLEGVPGSRVVGYRAKKNSLPIDLTRTRAYAWQDYWDPVYPEAGQRIVLEPEIFYLLISAEGVCIPPDTAAEMLAYDPTAGELRRTTLASSTRDSAIAPERRTKVAGLHSKYVPEMSHLWSNMASPFASSPSSTWAQRPDQLYGEDLGSNYQGQVSMLSKHFSEQTAGITQMVLPGASGVPKSQDPLFDS